MKRFVLGLFIFSISMLPFSAMADHPPKRLLKYFMAFSTLGKTDKLAGCDVNLRFMVRCQMEKPQQRTTRRSIKFLLINLIWPPL
jgi:hypothetical protein